MATRRFAVIMGVAFIVVGALGFVPGITRMVGDDPNLTLEGAGHGYLLGLFHVNVAHNLTHIIFGILGILLSRSFDSAVAYARIVAVAYGLLTIMGVVSTFNMKYTFGLVPIHGHDVWLHGLIAIVAGYFAFSANPVRPEPAADTTRPPV
jgi:hypothetical protein